MTPHWDVTSMIFYIFMGLISMFSISYVKRKEYISGNLYKNTNLIFMTWFIIWIVISVWRGVSKNIGGSDAITYIEYFRECLDPNLNTLYANHLDIGFQLLCKLIRIIFSDYHIFFIIIYGIIIYSYQAFINEFCLSDISFEPMILVFFIYLRGFNTIRTNLSVAFLLIALILLFRKKYKLMIMFIILSCGMHIATLLYSGFFIFYLVYKKNKIKLYHGIFLWGIAIGAANLFRELLIKTDLGNGLRGAYKSYALNSIGKSFFESSWKIAFGQLMLLLIIIILHKKIKKDISKKNTLNQERYNMIFLLCFYDFLMIPICHLIGMWRGYEYFYLPRLIMWGIVISVILKKFTKNSRIFIKIIIFTIFVSWMIFRLYNTWEESLLMPYIFEPLYDIYKYF